jgi:hypothetical protein
MPNFAPFAQRQLLNFVCGGDIATAPNAREGDAGLHWRCGDTIAGANSALILEYPLMESSLPSGNSYGGSGSTARTTGRSESS